MTVTADISTEPLEDKRGHKSRERRCVATGQVKDPALMLRFVCSPDKVVTPDIFEKLPGRGVWVTADRAHVEMAIKKKAFHHGFKSKVTVPDSLLDAIESGLENRVLGLLSMGMKSGHIHVGYDQVRAAASGGYLALRVEASDGSADSRGKIRVLTKAMSHELEMPDTPVIGCFEAERLGKALGRDHIVHIAVAPGSLSRSLKQAAFRLAGFRDMVPENWPDGHHETDLKSAFAADSRLNKR